MTGSQVLLERVADALARLRRPRPGDVHVTPVGDDGPAHVLTCLCWCEPALDHVTRDRRRRLWLHRRLQ